MVKVDEGSFIKKLKVKPEENNTEEKKPEDNITPVIFNKGGVKKDKKLSTDDSALRDALILQGAEIYRPSDKTSTDTEQDTYVKATGKEKKALKDPEWLDNFMEQLSNGDEYAFNVLNSTDDSGWYMNVFGTDVNGKGLEFTPRVDVPAFRRKVELALNEKKERLRSLNNGSDDTKTPYKMPEISLTNPRFGANYAIIGKEVERLQKEIENLTRVQDKLSSARPVDTDYTKKHNETIEEKPAENLFKEEAVSEVKEKIIPEVKKEIIPEVKKEEITQESLQESLPDKKEEEIKNAIKEDKKEENKEKLQEIIEKSDDETTKQLAFLETTPEGISEAERNARIEKNYNDYLLKTQRDEWLKNPSIFTGIFGKSGLTKWQKLGLGLFTLSAILSDAVSNYARGLNNEAGVKNTAMEKFNATIETIQNKRAEAIGNTIVSEQGAVGENDKKLQEDITKIRNSGASIYLDNEILKLMVQRAQLNIGENWLDENDYPTIEYGARQGFIRSIKKDKNLKDKLLTENNELTPEGELYFYDVLKDIIERTGKVINVSDKRIENTLKLLEANRKAQESLNSLSKNNLETLQQYQDAENRILKEMQEISTFKKEISVLDTKEKMLNMVKQYVDTFRGLSTTTTSEQVTQQQVDNFLNSTVDTTSKETMKEKYEKMGFTVELDAGGNIKIVKIEGKTGFNKEIAEKELEKDFKQFQENNTQGGSFSNSIMNSSNKYTDDLIKDLSTFTDRLEKDTEGDYENRRKELENTLQNRWDSLNNQLKEVNRLKNNAFPPNLRKVINTNVKEEEENNTNVTEKERESLMAFFNDVPTKNVNWYKNKLGLV